MKRPIRSFAVATAHVIASISLLAQPAAPRPGGNARIDEALGDTSEAKMTLFVLSVAPGASVPLRTHTGAAFAYVIEGEVEADSKTLPVGSFYSEHAGQAATFVRNRSASTPARILILQNSASLPKDAKPLLQHTLTDLKDLEVSFGKIVSKPGDPSPPPHQHPGPAFAYLWKGEVISQVEPDEPETYRAGEVFFESPNRVHKSYLNLSKTKSAELLLFVVRKKAQSTTPAPAK